ncbi:phage tail assembly chaperone [Brevundimonas phoenicis]|uniref:phage tail assembly chaperone n=1 Tax=unclassified Brevundimonas TaxID=2622653 RepID=UPI00399FF69B
MIYVIGKLGEPRIYLTTDDPASAQLQCQEGETAVQIDAVPVFEIPRDFRSQRNALLSASDWTQMADSNLSPERQAEWATYRQRLRDLDLTVEPDWPTPPAW